MEKVTRTGVLLVNLGTPTAPDFFSVRSYLKEFLSDSRVIEVNRVLWWLILNLIILNLRPFRSAKLYKAIWTAQGSPLLVESRSQVQALQESLGEDYAVALGMSYGAPSIKTGLLALRRAGVESVIILPLYPQHSGATTGSVFDAVTKLFHSCRFIPEFKFVSHYYKNQSYIEALQARVEEFWAKYGKPQKLVFSFHGLPKEYCDKGDPYFSQCHETAQLLAEALHLTSEEWLISFQSRVGKADWLKPYTDQLFRALPKSGVTDIQVFCPGFSSDCLETLEEIAIQGRHFFMEAGGKAYAYIPALNSSREHIQMMADLVRSA